MKFTVNREKLQKALQRVGSIIGARSMLPLLGNVLIEAGDGSLKLCTTDLDIRITTSVEAEVAEPGRSTVPARRLTQLVASFSADTVDFAVDEKDHFKLNCGTGRFTLLGLPAADFPEPAEFECIRELKLKESEFKHMISAIGYAVSADDSRKVLTGVLMNCHDSILTMVATDGKRMAMQERAPEVFTGEDGDAIVPLKAVNETKRLLEGSEPVSIIFGEKQCLFRGANFELTTKLIEGNYPNFRQVIPTACKREIEIPVEPFKKKIGTVSLLLSESSSYIILNFEEGKMSIKGSSSEFGEGSDSIDIAFEGEPFEVSFNPVYLVQPLDVTGCENIKLKVNDPLTPVTMEADEGFLYVIMPIRKKA